MTNAQIKNTHSVVARLDPTSVGFLEVDLLNKNENSIFQAFMESVDHTI